MGDDAINDLATTTACLDRLAADQPLNWQFDPTLVRGMGYYTGQIFELSHPGSRSSVAGGGRYDKLIGRSLDRDVPACGFSIGFERIVDLIERSARRDTAALLAEADVPAIEVLATARAPKAGPGDRDRPPQRQIRRTTHRAVTKASTYLRTPRRAPPDQPPPGCR
jgi:histidyl-tRNA synthetase